MKKAHLTAIIISTLLFSLMVSPNFVKADIVDVEGGLIAKGPYVISPTNTTYNFRFLTLNVSFNAAIYGNLNYSMTYSLDGRENETVPLALHYFGFDQQPKNYIDSLVILPELSETSHNITIYLKLEWTSNINNQVTSKTYHDSHTVYFTIDTTPPNISLKSGTYHEGGIVLLYFNVDEPSSWMGYSLDNQANVTITSNTTLSGLADGSHNLTVYANDTAGNMGKSDFVFYEGDILPISTPSPSPSPTQQPTLEPSPTSENIQAQNYPPAIIILSIVAGAVIIALLAYFAKHKGWK